MITLKQIEKIAQTLANLSLFGGACLVLYALYSDAKYHAHVEEDYNVALSKIPELSDCKAYEVKANRYNKEIVVRCPDNTVPQLNWKKK